MPDLRRFFGEGENGPGFVTRVPWPESTRCRQRRHRHQGWLHSHQQPRRGRRRRSQGGAERGREFTAKVIGRDPKTDVAVLKIDAHDLPFLTMADSDKVEVGDVVLAIGNPFGIGQTVTRASSAPRAAATLGLDYEDFIQTDAAINPGNSGGALVDTEGRLIGINTAILSRSGGNQGIGFAIPTNLARGVMESLVQDGQVTRGYLGVMIQDVTPALAKEFKLEDQPARWCRKSRRKVPPTKPG